VGIRTVNIVLTEPHTGELVQGSIPFTVESLFSSNVGLGVMDTAFLIHPGDAPLKTKFPHGATVLPNKFEGVVENGTGTFQALESDDVVGLVKYRFTMQGATFEFFLPNADEDADVYLHELIPPSAPFVVPSGGSITPATVVEIIESTVRRLALKATDLTISGNDIASLLDDAIGTGWRTGGSGGQTVTVDDEGTQITAALSSLNFVGGGVTATAEGGAVTVTIPGGGTPHPGTHTRWCGWANGQTPTQSELDLATDYSGDTLTIPRRTTNGFWFFMLPSTVADPVGVYLDNARTFNLLQALVKTTGTLTSGSQQVKVFTIDVLQSASAIGGGTDTLTLTF